MAVFYMTDTVIRIDRGLKLKILLVQSFLGRDDLDDLKVYPLGLVRLASCITNHDVQICDLNLYKDPQAALEKEILEYQPDLIGVSLRNIDNQDRINSEFYYKYFVEIIQKIKEVGPELPLVVGGMGFSLFAHEIMKDCDAIDFGVYLEAEETFPELLNNLENPESFKGIYYRKNGAVEFTGRRKIKEIDSLEPVRRDYIDMSLYPSRVTSIGVESKRGCSFNCIYCNYPFLSGNRIRLRKPEKVIDEIEEMVKKYGINKFIFVDPIFNFPEDHASEICSEIIKRGLNVKWGVYMDIRYASLNFLLLARSSGYTDFIFSPDGLTDNSLKSLKKGITENDIKTIYRLFKTNEKLKDAFVVFDLLLNPPAQDLRGLMKTLWFYIMANLSLRGRGRVTVNWIRIEPGTEIHKIAIASGAMKENDSLLPKTLKDLQNTFYSHPSLKKLDAFIIFFVKTVKAIKKYISLLLMKKD